MDILGKKVLEKLKRKNKGNTALANAIDKLTSDLEEINPNNPLQLISKRPDADCVYDGFYFFNISLHRTLVLIEFGEDGEATVVWSGSHDEYKSTFKNNKSTIQKWLKEREWI